MQNSIVKLNPRSAPNAARVAAFTLIEILVVLLVIGILSTVTVLTLGDGGRSSKLHEEALRLQATIKLAQEEAQLYGFEYGLSVEPHNYQFVTFGRDRWAPVADDKAYKKHKLDDEFQLALKIEGFKLGKQNGMLPGADIKDGKVVVRDEDDDSDDDSDDGGDGNDDDRKDDDGERGNQALPQPVARDDARKDDSAGESSSRRRKTYLPQVFLLSSGEINPFTLTIGSSEEPALFYRIRGHFNGSVTLEGPLDGDLIADMDKPWHDSRDTQRERDDDEGNDE
jgi:general secretion pathway protein H